jgi:hypothetical protein
VLDDRTETSIYDFINENIIENSIIKTDGFASYPRAVGEITVHM